MAAEDVLFLVLTAAVVTTAVGNQPTSIKQFLCFNTTEKAPYGAFLYYCNVITVMAFF